MSKKLMEFYFGYYIMVGKMNIIRFTKRYYIDDSIKFYLKKWFEKEEIFEIMHNKKNILLIDLNNQTVTFIYPNKQFIIPLCSFDNRYLEYFNQRFEYDDFYIKDEGGKSIMTSLGEIIISKNCYYLKHNQLLYPLGTILYYEDNLESYVNETNLQNMLLLLNACFSCDSISDSMMKFHALLTINQRV